MMSMSHERPSQPHGLGSDVSKNETRKITLGKESFCETWKYDELSSSMIQPLLVCRALRVESL